MRREGKKVRKTFRSYEEARQWRTTMQKLSQDGALRAPSAVSFRAAAEAWLRMAETGAIRTRSGDRYKPSALRGYEQALRLRLVPALGAHKLNDIDRADLQRLVAAWQQEGLSASSIRNTVNAVRAIYRDADLLAEGSIAINPTLGLRLPAVRGKRDRIAPPDEALRLLRALPAGDRALWATALFAGLRLGELMALRLEDIDLDQGTIKVLRSYDPKAGFVEPKSKAGRRRVPIAALLRELLQAHRELTGRERGLVFGRSGDRPFQPQTVNERARRAWAKADLSPIGLHECRHTCASFFIAAGVNAKTLSTFMGHASITTTLDRYGHLFPGSEAEAASLLDAYLARADSGSRIAQLEPRAADAR
ncbi:MAG: tyrosine-type recombinase/integrase [Solirubrobacterales bacterium]